MKLEEIIDISKTVGNSLFKDITYRDFLKIKVTNWIKKIDKIKTTT